MNIDPRAQLEAKRDALIAENKELKARSAEGMREREMRLIEREEAVEQHIRATSPAAASERAIFQQVSSGGLIKREEDFKERQRPSSTVAEMQRAIFQQVATGGRHGR